MRSKPILAFLSLAAVAAVSVSLSSSKPSQDPEDLKPARALSKPAKLALVKSRLKLTTAPSGIIDSLKLDVNNPAVPNRGGLHFKWYRTVTSISGPGYAEYGLFGEASPSGVKPSMTVYFRVARPNKRHLVTFYVSPFVAYGDLKFELTNGFPTQTEGCPEVRESKMAFVVFTPTKTGSQAITMTSPGGIRFNSVEIDVLD